MYERKNIIRNQAKSSNRDRIGQTVPKRSSQEVRNKRKDDSALDVEIPKGYRRIRDDLQHDFGINVNDKRVLKICRAKKIKSTIKYSRHGCTRSASSPQYVAENVLKRDFHAPKPNMKWLTDVTEFKWYEGVEVHKIYLNKKRVALMQPVLRMSATRCTESLYRLSARFAKVLLHKKSAGHSAHIARCKLCGKSPLKPWSGLCYNRKERKRAGKSVLHSLFHLDERGAIW